MKNLFMYLLLPVLFSCGSNPVVEPESMGKLEPKPEPKPELAVSYVNLGFDDSKQPSASWNRNHLLVTFYFNQTMDLQRNIQWKQDDFKMIEPWHRSVEWNKLKGVVFYDSLSQEFIDKYSTANIEFKKVESVQKYQVTSGRFLVTLEYLQDNPSIEYVFLTDGGDVIVRQNPFINMKPEILYVGSELRTVKSSWDWLVVHAEVLLNGNRDQISNYLAQLGNRVLLNAGISGGHRDIYIQFLEKMKEAFEGSSTSLEKSSDMAAFNWVLNQPEFVSKIATGHPVHSVFKEFDFGNQDVFFIHK